MACCFSINLKRWSNIFLLKTAIFHPLIPFFAIAHSYYLMFNCNFLLNMSSIQYFICYLYDLSYQKIKYKCHVSSVDHNMNRKKLLKHFNVSWFPGTQYHGNKKMLSHSPIFLCRASTIMSQFHTFPNLLFEFSKPSIWRFHVYSMNMFEFLVYNMGTLVNLAAYIVHVRPILSPYWQKQLWIISGPWC